MNYVVSSPSALVENNNLTLSPFSESEYDQISAFSFEDVKDFFKGSRKTDSITETVSSGSGDSSGSVFPYVFGTIGNIVGVLPQLGIGSKSRINEIRETADANTQVINAQLAASKLNQEQLSKQYKDQKGLLIIGGTFLLVIMIVLFTLKS